MLIKCYGPILNPTTLTQERTAVRSDMLGVCLLKLWWPDGLL